MYFVEMTDTFGGEANYSWVNRFLVNAISVFTWSPWLRSNEVRISKLYRPFDFTMNAYMLYSLV